MKKMQAKSLVQAWLEVELHHNEKSLVKALNEMNDKLGTSYTHSRVREWEDNRNGRGERLPRSLRIFMAKKVLKHVLESAGIDSAKISTKMVNKIANMLT